MVFNDDKEYQYCTTGDYDEDSKLKPKMMGKRLRGLRCEVNHP